MLLYFLKSHRYLAAQCPAEASECKRCKRNSAAGGLRWDRFPKRIVTTTARSSNPARLRDLFAAHPSRQVQGTSTGPDSDDALRIATILVDVSAEILASEDELMANLANLQLQDNASSQRN